MNPELAYPPSQTAGTRRLRRWEVVLRTDVRAETLVRLGGFLRDAIEVVRFDAFGALDRDLLRFDPRVVLEPSGKPAGRHVTLEISYDPSGTIGDCEMIALWVPLRVLNVTFGIGQLQGVEGHLWTPLVAGLSK